MGRFEEGGPKIEERRYRKVVYCFCRVRFRCITRSRGVADRRRTRSHVPMTHQVGSEPCPRLSSLVGWRGKGLRSAKRKTRARRRTEVTSTASRGAARQRRWTFNSSPQTSLAHESRSGTTRLKTSLPGAESFVSTQKYPSLSNWYVIPGAAFARLASTNPLTVSSDPGLRCFVNPSPSVAGLGTLKRRS